jgi:hypothetical protein
MGRIDARGFAGGTMTLDARAAEDTLLAHVGEAMGLDAIGAAEGVIEIVDENMASATRVHAVERGTEVAGRTMIAFGGAAPLHAARLAEKLGIDRVVVPANAGVGSAVGMLLAPIAYEVVRSRYMRLSDFDVMRRLPWYGWGRQRPIWAKPVSPMPDMSGKVTRSSCCCPNGTSRRARTSRSATPSSGNMNASTAVSCQISISRC